MVNASDCDLTITHRVKTDFQHHVILEAAKHGDRWPAAREKALNRIATLRVMLSGYPNPLYAGELAGWRREDFQIDNKGGEWKSETADDGDVVDEFLRCQTWSHFTSPNKAAGQGTLPNSISAINTCGAQEVPRKSFLRRDLRRLMGWQQERSY
jgi:hypothetical protein